MSDEIFDRDDRPTEGRIEPERGLGYLTGIIVQILKWLGIILGVVIFVVTIVIITLNIVDRRSGTSQTRIPNVEEYSAQPPILEWYSNINEIRGSTADETRRTFIVEPHIGYDLEDRLVQTELIARTIQVREIIAFYFSSQVATQLEGVENRQRVKADLTREINRIMRSGKIRDVAFDRYQIVEF